MGKVIQIRDYEPKHAVKVAVRRVDSVPKETRQFCEPLPPRRRATTRSMLLVEARYRNADELNSFGPETGVGET